MVTQKDVAKRVGVSVATVSRYINKKGYISPEIKKLINQAVIDLQYKPNLVARSLKLKHTKTIGLVFPDIENPFFVTVIKKAEEYAHCNGYTIMLCNTENNTEKERDYLEVLKSRLVDGYIIIPSISNIGSQYNLLKKEKVVFLDRLPGVENEICITLENAIGVELAVHHLAELGHRKIGAIHVPQYVSTGLERFQGFQQALSSYGIEMADEYSTFVGYSIEDSHEKTKDLLSRQDRPTAIIPMCGPTTIGALHAIRELKMRIPDDISIIGFDEIYMSDLLSPPLTTVTQPAEDFGKMAIEILLQTIKGRRVKQKTFKLNPRLIVRESCKRLGLRDVATKQALNV